MNRLFPSALIALSLVSVPVLPAAEANSGPPAVNENPAAKPSLRGQYSGKWKSTADATGGLRIKLEQGSSTWVAEASFTFEGAEVPGTVKSIQVEGTRIHLIFDWKIQDTTGQSKLTGELTGDTLQGKYETSGAVGASSGTWSVTRG